MSILKDIAKTLNGEPSSSDVAKKFHAGTGSNANKSVASPVPNIPKPALPVLEGGSETLEKFEDIPNLQELLAIVYQSIEKLPAVRDMQGNLSAPRAERTKFKKLSEGDAKALQSLLDRMESVFWEVNIHQLPADNHTSLDRFLNFKKEDILFPIRPDNLYVEDVRFISKIMQFLDTKATTLTTVEEVDALANKLNSLENAKQYFKKVNFKEEALANFPTMWVHNLHSYAKVIAERDMGLCLIPPIPEKTPVDEVDDKYAMMITGKSIINRMILSNDMRISFLNEFKPVLEALIDYFHKYAKVKVVNGYLGEALDIKEELYANIPQSVVLDSTADEKSIPDNFEVTTDSEASSQHVLIEEQQNDQGKIIDKGGNAEVILSYADRIKQRALNAVTSKNKDLVVTVGDSILVKQV